MCGRYVITTAPEALREFLGYLERPNFPARYNVAPTQPVPVVRLVNGARRFALMRWGLIPAWVKDPRAFSLVFNARGESVTEKPAFRLAIRRRRCLLPADGFYEWKSDGTRKRPHFIAPRRNGPARGGPVAFAGLWEAWMGPNGEEVESVCIVTTCANATLAALHDRMPAVIAPGDFERWLDCRDDDAAAATPLIKSAHEDLFEAFEVSSAVNLAAADEARLIAPLSPEERAAALDSVGPTREKKPREKKKDERQPSLF